MSEFVHCHRQHNSFRHFNVTACVFVCVYVIYLVFRSSMHFRLLQFCCSLWKRRALIALKKLSKKFLLWFVLFESTYMCWLAAMSAYYANLPNNNPPSKELLRRIFSHLFRLRSGSNLFFCCSHICTDAECAESFVLVPTHHKRVNYHTSTHIYTQCECIFDDKAWTSMISQYFVYQLY